MAIAAAEVEIADLDGRRSYNLLLTGEVLRNDVLFESFRYRFDVPADRVTDSIPLSFERLLRVDASTLNARHLAHMELTAGDVAAASTSSLSASSFVVAARSITRDGSRWSLSSMRAVGVLAAGFVLLLAYRHLAARVRPAGK